MSTFIMFGRYSQDALKGISAKRTEKAREIIEKAGGKILSMYALLGKIDLVTISIADVALDPGKSMRVITLVQPGFEYIADDRLRQRR